MSDSKPNCECLCGETTFNVVGKPLMRGYCHCTICQSFNKSPYGDITLFRSGDVIMPADDLVDFKSYKAPPILKRGSCVACGGAAIENLKVPFLNIMIVPSNNIKDKTYLPEPELHIFYNHRVADVNDDLPKYSGYFSSQIAFLHRLMSRLIRS